MRKLVLIFDEDNEVNGVDKVLIFNNALDAEEFLIKTGKINKIKFDFDANWFNFKTTAWDGVGRAYWGRENPTN